MLPPDSRVVLLDELRPPLGCTLDVAVATTFTLDLAAALIPPLSFAARNLRTDADPIAALDAVRSCADRVDIFCQAGYMTVPTQASDLMEFLAPMVHEVNAPRGFLFHPKLWLLRYADNEGSRTYRLLCMSRNLTNDHAWDVSVRLDGAPGRRALPANAPLAGLLRALPSLTLQRSLPPDRIRRMEVLAEDVRRVEWDRPQDVSEVSFHVLGVRGVRSTPPDFHGYRTLVVSPFLTDGGLDLAAPDRRDTTVVSRVEQLDGLSRETIENIRCYQLSSVAGLDENAPEEEGEGPGRPAGALAGLHAKLYVVERARRAHVFIGSANATDGGFHGNVELLVELVGGATKLGVSTFIDGDAPFKSLLEEYEPAGEAPRDPTEEARWRLERVVRGLAALAYTADVIPSSGLFTVVVSSREPIPLPPGYSGTVELLTRPGNIGRLTSGEPLQSRFERVELADVTPFLVLRVTSPEGLVQGTVTKAQLLHEPEGRLDEVLARQIDTPEKFFRFLTLLLSLRDGDPIPPPSGYGNGRAGVTDPFGRGPGLFETVVRGLADHPDAIPDVDRLVKRLEATERGRQTLGDDFLALWSTVMKAHHAASEVRDDAVRV